MERVENYIAARYVLTRGNLRFINVIGIISITGITVGVAALLIALSVFNGFAGVVTSVLVGFDPHVRIEKKGNIDAAEASKIDMLVKQYPSVIASSPFVAGKAMVVAKSFNRVVFIRGVDENRIGKVSGLKEKIVLGNLSLGDAGGEGGIVIGLTLADRLGSVVGDEIAIMSPYGLRSSLEGSLTPQTMKFRITGIYESNNKDYDGEYAYLSVTRAQNLFEMGDQINGFELRLDDISRADEVKRSVATKLPPEYSISTWYDLHKSLYQVMRIERWSAYILLCIIILVATFNMLGSLTMSVIEKRRDIAILKSMGMTTGGIIRIFMFEGMLIGAAGTVFGIAIGLVVLFLQVQYHLVPLDTNVYIIPAIPVEIQWPDFIAVSFASLGLSYLASYYPSRRAAKTPPADALRWE